MLAIATLYGLNMKEKKTIAFNATFIALTFTLIASYTVIITRCNYLDTSFILFITLLAGISLGTAIALAIALTKKLSFSQ